MFAHTDLQLCIYGWKVFCLVDKIAFDRSIIMCDGDENVTKQLRRPRLAARR